MADEFWLRGPVEGVPALLQPVAHSLLQCRQEVRAVVSQLPVEALSRRPAGVASIDYHVRHAAGALDRLFTYASGDQLSEAQRATLGAEKQASGLDAAALVSLFDQAAERALAQLLLTSEATLLDVRAVGRARLPSTVLGLLFHAAEHTQRHVGQLTTTAAIVRGAAST
jgi:uncharacterized damage-inducible protein DinB